MTYRGRMTNGVIVLTDSTRIPEGAEVRVSISPGKKNAKNGKATRKTKIGNTLLKFAGKARGLPPDASWNHDHYLYGTPKKNKP